MDVNEDAKVVLETTIYIQFYTTIEDALNIQVVHRRKLYTSLKVYEVLGMKTQK